MTFEKLITWNGSVGNGVICAFSPQTVVVEACGSQMQCSGSVDFAPSAQKLDSPLMELV